MTTEQTVFVVDDEEVVLKSVEAVVKSVEAVVKSLEVQVKTFTSAESFLASYSADQPGCLVTDLRMLGMSGIELQEKLVAMGIKIPVIIITAFADVQIAVRAMRTGAVTLLEKPCRDQELWEAVRNALELDRSTREEDQRRSDVQSRMGNLSEGERDVMERMVEGKMNKVIAQELSISIRTVETRRHNVLEKMRADSLADLVRLVVESE